MRDSVTLGIIAGLLSCLTAAPHAAAQTDAARVEVPIRQVVLSNHDIRYAVPVSVGAGRPVDAELDTGSFGLRILAAAVDPSLYQASTIERAFPYASGARLRGFIATARIGIGGAMTPGPMGFQVVQKVDCAEQKPNCPAARVSQADYRIAGDGLPGEGFDAILGISMRSAGTAVAANNPLNAIGSGAWIVLLPRPGETEPGRLIINPTPDDLQGFTLFQLAPQDDPRRDPDASPGWLDGKLPGCLTEGGSTSRFCAPTVIDTGEVGILAESPDAAGRKHWRDGTSGRIELTQGGAVVTAPFTVGRDKASRVTILPQSSNGGARLTAGVLPYFFYAVAYDSRAGTIGFKPRGTPPAR